MNESCVGPLEPVTASFRDPAGQLFALDRRIFRIVKSKGSKCLASAINSPAVQSFIDRGSFVRTEILSPASSAQVAKQLGDWNFEHAEERTEVVEHEAIEFPSYAYEWPPEMLWAAGVLTLELARELTPEGLGLKDATPYNILYRGPTPVFIDVLSIEPRDHLDPIWLPRAEFIRTFILPLLANKRLGIPLDQLMTRREGVEPELMYRWLTPIQKLLPGYLTLVSMPVWLASKAAADPRIYRKRAVSSAEKSRFILDHAFSTLHRQLNAVAPARNRESAWSNYMQSKDCKQAAVSYTHEEFARKEQIVTKAIAGFAPVRVLDIGCNTGHFSRIAARKNAAVVALDADPAVVGQTWRSAREEKLNILPLVVNIAKPSPALGWRNAEYRSFLSRATGAFDLVLMLAVVHHMLATERIPLREILKLASELTTDGLIIEFVPPDDPMFRSLSRGRDELYAHLNPDLFERTSKPFFEIVQRHAMNSGRWLYVMRKRLD